MFRSSMFVIVLSVLMLCGAQVEAVAFQDAEKTPPTESDWDSKSKETFGYFEAALANASAIRSVDCLIHFKDNFDSVGFDKNNPNSEGAITANTVWLRLRFDFDKQKAAISRRRFFESTDLSLTDPKTGKPGRRSVVRFSWGSCLNVETNQLFQFRNGNLVENVTGGRTLQEQMITLGIPDPRGLGWTGVLDGSTFVNFQDWVRLARAGHHLFEVTEESNKRLKIRRYTGLTKDAAYYTDFEVDPNTNNILRSKSYRQDPDNNRRVGITDDFRTEWIEVSGLQLPAKVVVTGVASKRIGKATKSQWGHVHKEYTFHWFSVNEPIEDSAFDGSEIKDEASLNRLVDPVETDAKSLVELLDQQQINEKPAEKNK